MKEKTTKEKKMKERENNIKVKLKYYGFFF